MLKKRFYYAIAMLWLLFVTFTSYADNQTNTHQPGGISFYVTRVIYHEGNNNSHNLTMHNKGNMSYLVQSWVNPVDLKTGEVDFEHDKHATMPLLVIPPLSRLEPKGELLLRLIRNDQRLPDDRESVFYISMKAVPSQDKAEPSATDANVVYTVVSSMKVFYRPASLKKRAIADLTEQLTVRREGNTLIVDNPTAYWLTFSRLKLGDQILDKEQLRLMVPAKGQQRYRFPNKTTGSDNSVSWILIDEDGWDTPVVQRQL